MRVIIFVFTAAIALFSLGCDSVSPIEQARSTPDDEEERLPIAPSQEEANARYTLAYAATRVYGDALGRSRIVVQVPGEEPTVLASDSLSSFRRPRWSPDGDRLLFEGGPDAAIYVAQAGGSDGRPVTSGPCDDTAEWSPDGMRIAYSSGCGAAGAIHVLDLQSWESMGLAKSMQADLPKWSPDGTQLIFRVWPTEDASFDIWIMNADGSGMRPLADLEGEKQFAAWAPDGASVIFSLGPGDDNDLYRTGADATAPKRLTTSAGVDGEPTWSPNGEKIAFVSTRDVAHSTAVYRLFLMDSDGSRQEQLSPLSAHNPTWSPDGKRIAFSTGSAIVILNPADGTVDIVADAPNTFYTSPRFSPVQSK